MDFFQQVSMLAASNPWEWLKTGFTWFLERVFDLTMSMGVPSYALAIFIFTVIVKLAMQPTMNKQQRSMRQMGKLQPKLQELQKKFAGNPQKLQQETMKLYKDEGVSPFAGCLPLLIQMPILFALFAALRNFVPAFPEYYRFLWIADLSHPDPTGWVLPVLTGAATFLQQCLTITNKSDRTQKMMLYMMPIMFAWMTRTFPAFMALYWIYYNLIGGTIQFLLNKRWAKQDAIAEAERAAREEEERLQKKIKKAEQKGKTFVEDENEEKDENTVEVNGVEYILPPGYTLREKRVRAHPYSTEEEIVTVAVLPDGRERPVEALKRKEMPAPQLPSFNLGWGKKNKKE